jgi:hypothetical protein
MEMGTGKTKVLLDTVGILTPQPQDRGCFNYCTKVSFHRMGEK